MAYAVILLLVGLGVLIWGADRLLLGAIALAHALRLSPMMIGMTVVGIGTSIPEIVVSLIAALNGQLNAAVGNVLGSNIVNILLILGILALIQPLKISKGLRCGELPWLLAISLLPGPLLYDHWLSRWDGIILCTVLLIFITCMLNRPNRSAAKQQSVESNTVSWTGLFWVLLGLILLPVAAKTVVDNAIIIARYFGLSELVIGLTIIALGTSLPELATSVAGILKGEHEMVLGNIIGSNIFNILLIMGITALLAPGQVEPAAFTRDYWVMLGSSGVLLLCCWQRRPCINRYAGVAMLVGFIGYQVVLLYHQI